MHFYIQHFDKPVYHKEDLFFAVKCKEKGIPVHADVRVKSGHVFRYVQNVL